MKLAPTEKGIDKFQDGDLVEINFRALMHPTKQIGIVIGRAENTPRVFVLLRGGSIGYYNEVWLKKKQK